jgi:hypothetical protein
MRLALIAWFTGTARNCFDGIARPVPRLGGQA